MGWLNVDAETNQDGGLKMLSIPLLKPVNLSELFPKKQWIIIVDMTQVYCVQQY